MAARLPQKKTSSPPSGQSKVPTPTRSGTIPKLWDDDESERTSATSATSRRQTGTPGLKVITGHHAGETIPIPDRAELYIGRGRDTDIRLEDQGVSRVHCRMVRRDGGFMVQDLGSTNGTKVNGKHVGTAPVGPGDRLELGPHAILQLVYAAESEDTLARRLFSTATRDPLTRTYKRAYFMDRLEAEASYARRHATGLALLCVDVDRLDSHNEAHGHEGGDAVLRAIAEEITKCVRTEDVLARYGDDELAILVRVTASEEAVRLAERIRGRVETLAIPFGEKSLKATVSVGIATVADSRDDASPADLVGRAERHRARAKLLGRNRVCKG
jgi:diguanylate cyclase (GGDEF)-like protein